MLRLIKNINMRRSLTIVGEDCRISTRPTKSIGKKRSGTCKKQKSKKIHKLTNAQNRCLINQNHGLTGSLQAYVEKYAQSQNGLYLK